MLTKRAAAEQLRKYAAVARLVREQRIMQKQAGWFSELFGTKKSKPQEGTSQQPSLAVGSEVLKPGSASGIAEKHLPDPNPIQILLGVRKPRPKKQK